MKNLRLERGEDGWILCWLIVANCVLTLASVIGWIVTLEYIGWTESVGSDRVLGAVGGIFGSILFSWWSAASWRAWFRLDARLSALYAETDLAGDEHSPVAQR